MQEFVTVSGFRTFTAASAEEALALLEERQVDVVITDIMLPGMDGLELTDIIKKDYNIDVIVLTGYSGDYSYEEAISKGASDLVFKPVRFEELILRLKRVLERAQADKRTFTDARKTQKAVHYGRSHQSIQFKAFLQPAQELKSTDPRVTTTRLPC